VNTLINVRYSNCLPLQLRPINKCARLYDTVRRDNNTLWVGNQFPGEPPVWQAPCDVVDRPQIYDTYSLSLYDPYFGAGAGIQSSVEQFLEFDDGVSNSVGGARVDYLDHLLHTTQVYVAAAPSLFNHSNFLLLALISLVFLF